MDGFGPELVRRLFGLEPVLYLVRIEIDARVVFNLSPAGYKHEIALPEEKLDLIDASVFYKFFQVTFEVGDSIANAGFMADAMIVDPEA